MLIGQVTADDLALNRRVGLPYGRLGNPVFRLSIGGEICIFMLDTGSTCNLAFQTFLDKFPGTEVRPSNRVVQGVGGLTTTVTAEFYVTLLIGGQETAALFLLSDFPISNLDGIVGLEALTQFHSWSVGGSRLGGAYLEINNVRFALCGFGDHQDSSANITMITQNCQPNDPAHICPVTQGLSLSSICQGSCQDPVKTYVYWTTMEDIPYPAKVNLARQTDHEARTQTE